MHVRELIDLAGMLAAHAPALIRSVPQFSETGLDDYWTASKCRLDRWAHALKRISREAAAQGPAWHEAHGPAVAALVEEILGGELLTRVWAAVLSAHDRRHGVQQADPIARSVLIGHLEARHRVLVLLAGDTALGTQRAIRFDRFRRRCDRWSDMLVGFLADTCDMQLFAVEPLRAREFAEDVRSQAGRGNARQAWPLVQIALQASFLHGLMPSSPNADLNARIAGGVLASLPPELFDSTGLLRTLCALRLGEAADDVQGLLDQVLLADPRNAPRSGFLAPRWRRFH